MLVMVLENVPPSLRGELTRWLLEVRAGVYVGSVSATVRDLLWDKAVQHTRSGRCTQVFRAANEQGFRIRQHGEHGRRLVEIDGYQLIAVANARHADLLPQFKSEEEAEWETL